MKALYKFCCCTLVFMLCACFLMQDNVYAEAYEPVKMEIPAVCSKVEGDTDHVYTVVIEPQDDAPVPETDTLRIEQDSSDKFVIYVTEPGTFTYLMYEKPESGNDKIKYDEKVYTIKLYSVLPDDGGDELQCSVVVGIEGETVKPTAVNFTNILAAEDQETTTTTSAQTTTSTKDPNSLVPPSVPDQQNVSGVTDRPKYQIDSSGDQNSKPSAVTGDNLPVGLIAGIMAGAALVILLILVFGRKGHNND